ncbi:sensor histidine kinase [Mangrovibacterium marinum]|uniref:histidine kinase n=1 Tax=Mangrovibacterium marinum TaxID=1639118 RepID=A0A2T5C2E6_9BACT|nr:sensor histidine kinase [Mangrovibacterium marinum]PTN08904.1 signal transduction histidine kinase [Mangrovibacterium marinum]
MKEKISGECRLFFLKRYVVVFFLFLLFAAFGFYLLVHSLVVQQQLLLRVAQEKKLMSERDLTEHLIDEAVLDLLTISDSKLFHDFFNGKIEDPSFNQSLSQLFIDLLEKKQDYYQLRYLERSGKEVFRIEWRQGSPYICRKDELQDKSHRYYFQETIKLNPGEFYISPLDLNIEHGQIELPFRPMIRIGLPVYNDHGAKLGIVILNYDATTLLQKLDAKSLSGEGVSYLVNAQGYFMNARDTALEWGFMFPDKKAMTIDRIFPKESEQLMNLSNGQITSDAGIFTVMTVWPFRNIGALNRYRKSTSDYSWKLISLLPAGQLAVSKLVPLGGFIAAAVLVFILGLVLAYFYARNSVDKQRALRRLMDSEAALKEANSSKDRFFSILAHDLKNGSGPIAQYLELIHTDFDDFTEEERKSHIKDVSLAARQHNRLLNDILEWARHQMGKTSCKPELVNIGTLVREQIEMASVGLKKKELVPEISIEPALTAWADPDMLKTILRNLINNAIKYSYRGGKIAISGSEQNHRVEIRIVDFGVGMSPAEQAKIFDLSSKVQRFGTENESGTGFGLKLVHELVAKNKGTIKVESEENKGSAFILSFPASG